MKKVKIQFAILLGTLFASIDRLFLHPRSTVLPNSLGLFNEHGIESLILDPATGSAPFGNRYLLVQRGASGAQYGDLCAGGAGGNLPLGPTSDAPYAAGDVLNVRRLGVRPGIELGIATGAVTIDHILVSAAGGKVQDIATVTVNGTYWVVGRAAATIAANNSTLEIPYVPDVPYQVTVSNGGGTYAYAGAGV